MEYIENYLLKLSAKSQDIMVPGYGVGNINPYFEWVKWLSYTPDFEKTKIELLETKKVCDLTEEELNEITKYKEQTRMAELFKIYGTDEISEDEYIEVYNYMLNQSIEDLMLSKLSSDELLNAKEQIKYFCKISDEELDEKIEIEQLEDNYKQLSMSDSYVLHVISRVNFLRGINDLNQNIEDSAENNKNMMYRSSYNASNHNKNI